MKPEAPREHYVMRLGVVRDHALSAFLSKAPLEHRVPAAGVSVQTAKTYCEIHGTVEVPVSDLDMAQKAGNGSWSGSSVELECRH